ncbi:hypothetical protein [Flavobacterium sp.]|uniref:hypothetical protein n=1 Tax=Flavobacterium sp. TaxID=239 RepID=UPI0025C0357C|nr:hypothetical protein [Flavobacterium sp.]MBA4153209.1 hypothetical protein [Flavobacterium sp.]
MKNLVIYILFFLLTGCGSSRIDKKTNENINNIVENERVIMTFKIYENDMKFMSEKYNIEYNKPKIQDVTSIKLFYEMCVNDIHLELKNSLILKEREKVLSKWIDNRNYNPKLHFVFENEKEISPSLSFLKAMDFYKSDDLRVYLNKFKKEIIKLYISNQNPDINPCIENEGHSNWKIWENDSLNEIRLN